MGLREVKLWNLFSEEVPKMPFLGGIFWRSSCLEVSEKHCKLEFYIVISSLLKSPVIRYFFVS